MVWTVIDKGLVAIDTLATSMVDMGPLMPSDMGSKPDSHIDATL